MEKKGETFDSIWGDDYDKINLGKERDTKDNYFMYKYFWKYGKKIVEMINNISRDANMFPDISNAIGNDLSNNFKQIKMPKTGKKSSTPTKGAKKAKGQRYEYTELSKGNFSSTDYSHAYGVIVDATFPYKSSQNLYVCSLKIADASLNQNTKGASWANVVIYAKRFEDLPIVLRLGDVIRLHRATARMHNGIRQYNVSVQINGSWALWSTDKLTAEGRATSDFQPTSLSGKRFSFEKHETATLGNIRK